MLQPRKKDKTPDTEEKLTGYWKGLDVLRSRRTQPCATAESSEAGPTGVVE